MFQKIKNKLKNFMTNKAAFSLVELIVVIAIMAVMAAVLAPALLGYVEKSRMQKDDSAMDEVVNAIQLSLADQEIYDEVLEHSVWDNVSCYIDQKEESKFASHKVTLKAANGDKKEQYIFGDEARLLDETVYYAAGNMRGLTITFSPNESGDTYDFANGILNKFVGRKTGLLSENPELYNRLRSVIGDKLDTTSQTYRNSDYTIFIRVGSTGGGEAVMQDAIQVWGQFNGTNLAEKDHKFELSSGRVVGAAGADDTTNNQTNNESGNVDFSENPRIIKEMSINGTTYSYVEGMTWKEWCDSDYNQNVLQYKTEWDNTVFDVNNTSSGYRQVLRLKSYLVNQKIDFTKSYDDDEISGYDTIMHLDHLVLPIEYVTLNEAHLPGGEMGEFLLIDIEDYGYYVLNTNGVWSVEYAPQTKQVTLGSRSYDYQPNMTWEQWVHSRYNYSNFQIYDGNIYKEDSGNKWISYGLLVYYSQNDETAANGLAVTTDSPIVDGCPYILTSQRYAGDELTSFSELPSGTQYIDMSTGTPMLKTK